MSEGDFTPRTGTPKPLTRAQLRELQKRFKKTNVIIQDIQNHEESHKEEIDEPQWV